MLQRLLIATTCLFISLSLGCSSTGPKKGCSKGKNHECSHDCSKHKGHKCKHKHEMSEGRIGEGLEFVAYRGLYFTAQPKPTEIAQLPNEEIMAVINLRSPSELKKMTFDEKQLVEQKNIAYYNVPVPKDEPLSEDAMQEIEQKVMEHHKKGQNVLIHCSTGQRAASWLAYHMAATHKKPVKKALKKAQRVGLDKPEMKKKVRELLKTLKASSAQKAEKKPKRS